MTTKASARPQPLVPDTDVASSIQDMPSKACSSSRGYSDSEVPSCRASGEKKYHIADFGPPGRNNLAAAAIQASNMHSLPPLVKCRQHLQLPSFRSLGISSRIPDALLTPPDETTIYDCMTTPPPTSFPSASRRSSYPTIIMPKTPSPDRSDFTSMLGQVVTASEAPTTTASNYQSLAVSEAQAGDAEHGTDPTRSDSEDSDAVPGQFGWLKEATDALGELHEIIARHGILFADHRSRQHRCRCYKLCRVYPLPYPTLPSHEHRDEAQRREQAAYFHR